MHRRSSPTGALLVGLVAVTACSKSNVITTNNNNTTINNITQTVGSSGAHLESPGGAILDIPPGALTVDVDISIGEIDLASAPAIPNGATPRSAVFSFQPHGQTFAQAVTLTLPHRAANLADLRVYRADPGGAWAVFPSEPPTANRVQALARQFSLYMVAEAPGAPAVDAGAPLTADGAAETPACKTDADCEFGSRCEDTGPDGQGKICQFVTECNPDACVSDLASAACGGAPAGMWDVTGTCGLTSNADMAMQACPAATFAGTTSASGRLTLAGAGSYMLDVDVVGTGTITVPQPCNQFGCMAIQGFLAGAFETVRCNDDGGGGCRCLTTTRDRRNETGTWTARGTELVFTSTAAPGGRRVWFSASDTVLLLQERADPGMPGPPPLRFVTSGP
jgi:hypothetical protein